MQDFSDSSTDDAFVLPWKDGDAFAAPSVLHLVVAWVLDEPERAGQVARIDRPCFLGRGDEAESELPAIEFMEARPGESLCAPLLQPKTLSRRQLEFEPVSESCVRVECVGKRRLFRNGIETRTCEVQAGDVLMVEHSAVFLVALLPTALPSLRHYPGAGFRFGEADPDDLVGESPAACALREALGAAAASGQHVLLTGESGSGRSSRHGWCIGWRGDPERWWRGARRRFRRGWWTRSCSGFLAATDREVLQDAGRVTAEIAKAHAEAEFEKYRIVQDRLFESDFDRVVAETKRLGDGTATLAPAKPKRGKKA